MAQSIEDLPARQETLETLVRSLSRIPWRRKRQPTLVFLPRGILGQRSLAGYRLRSRKESDTAEQLSVDLPSAMRH